MTRGVRTLTLVWLGCACAWQARAQVDYLQLANARGEYLTRAGRVLTRQMQGLAPGLEIRVYPGEVLWVRRQLDALCDASLRRERPPVLARGWFHGPPEAGEHPQVGKLVEVHVQSRLDAEEGAGERQLRSLLGSLRLVRDDGAWVLLPPARRTLHHWGHVVEVPNRHRGRPFLTPATRWFAVQVGEGPGCPQVRYDLPLSLPAAPSLLSGKLQVGPPAPDPKLLLARLGGRLGRPEKRRVMGALLEQSEHPEVRRWIEERIARSDGEDRHLFLRSLGDWKSERAAALLYREVERGTWRARQACAQALEDLGQVGAGPVKVLLASRDRTLQYLALFAAHSCGVDAMQQAARLVRAPETDLQFAAWYYLSKRREGGRELGLTALGLLQDRGGSRWYPWLREFLESPRVTGIDEELVALARSRSGGPAAQTASWILEPRGTVTALRGLMAIQAEAEEQGLPEAEWRLRDLFRSPGAWQMAEEIVRAYLRRAPGPRCLPWLEKLEESREAAFVEAARRLQDAEPASRPALAVLLRALDQPADLSAVLWAPIRSGNWLRLGVELLPHLSPSEHAAFCRRIPRAAAEVQLRFIGQVSQSWMEREYPTRRALARLAGSSRSSAVRKMAQETLDGEYPAFHNDAIGLSGGETDPIPDWPPKPAWVKE